MQVSDTRRSAVVEAQGDRALSQLTKLVKLGVKGPGVPAFAQRLGIPFPAKLYDVVLMDGSLIARVGGDELIVEAGPGNPLLAKLEQALAAGEAGVYRIEQQSV